MSTSDPRPEGETPGDGVPTDAEARQAAPERAGTVDDLGAEGEDGGDQPTGGAGVEAADAGATASDAGRAASAGTGGHADAGPGGAAADAGPDGTADDEVIDGAVPARIHGRAADAGAEDAAGPAGRGEGAAGPAGGGQDAAGSVGGGEDAAGPAGGGEGDGRDGVGSRGDWVLPPVAAVNDVEDGDDGDDGADGRSAWWRGRSAAGVLVGLLLGLLGFALAVQVRSNTSTSGLPAARQEDLVRILDDISSREERLRRQIADLEAARTRLSTAGDRSSTALQEARTRSTALGILAGTVPAQGPGVELTIIDPERRFAAEDLLDAVEELRAAGAEAIQVGGVRVGLDTAFVGTDRGIAVDGVRLTAPYTVVAIGEPATLATAMDIPGGVSDTARRARGDARVAQRDKVVIRAVRTPASPRYSKPAD